ncbi:MAG: hypothetical protein QOE48_2550 [Mycobacterium sp.]|nr:hypothetical protein [Mycobacterium sp.]
MTFTDATYGCGDRTSRQGGLGNETYRGAGLDNVRKIRLRVCRDQYHRDRRPVVAILKCLSKIEAALFSEIHIDKCDVGSQFSDVPQPISIR